MKRFIYTAPLIVSQDECIQDVSDRIVALGVNEALVKDSQQNLCGIVCLYDICRYLLEMESREVWKQESVAKIMHEIEASLHYPSLITDLKSLDTQFCYIKIPVFLN